MGVYGGKRTLWDLIVFSPLLGPSQATGLDNVMFVGEKGKPGSITDGLQIMMVWLMVTQLYDGTKAVHFQKKPYFEF